MEIRGRGIRGFAKGKAFVVNDFSKRNPFEGIPEGSVLVCPAVTLSDSTLIDFRKVVAIVTSEPDSEGEACLIASGMGIPALVGMSGCLEMIVNGDRLLIRNLDLVINPELDTLMEFDRMRNEASSQLRINF
ncbi:MAG: PEP-utilizing enzyme [Candidatus Cryptobacteroides sp.]